MDNRLNGTLKRAAFGAALLVGLAGPLYAGGGVIEFNQARALAGGVTPGDTPGFPVTISQSGSYRLSGNLTVPNANTTAISVTADNVTIDLNGFSILGPTVCSGGPPVTSCVPTGTGNGIDGSSKSDITVANGTIHGMGNAAIQLGDRARVDKLRAVSNGAGGCGSNFGIVQTGNQSIINGTAVVGNGDGLCGAAGIWTRSASVVNGNIAQGNAGFAGIMVEESSVVTGNTADRNAVVGIGALDGTLILGNTASHNGGNGLWVGGGDVGYGSNVLHLNAWGPTIGGPTDMGHNDCNWSTTCP